MSTTSSPVTPLPQLHIDTSWPSPAIVRVAVVGEVDLATAPAFRDRLLSVLHEATPAVVDVDLAGVSFLDCRGIGVLVAVRNIAVQAGHHVRVSHPRPASRRVLELTGLLGILTAAIDQPEQPTPESDPAGGAGPAAATTVAASHPCGQPKAGDMTGDDHAGGEPDHAARGAERRIR